MKKILLLVLIAALFMPLAAQDSDLTIEEAYLLLSRQLLIIQTLSLDNDYDSKITALDMLSVMIEEGELSDESDDRILGPAVGVLEDMGMQGTARIYMENGRVTNYYTDVRIRAAQVLGELGGEKAREALMNIMMTDDEPAVLLEAVRALADNVTNDDVTPQLVIADVIYSQTAINKDNRLAFEFLLAVETMAGNGVEISDVIFEEVVKIANRRNGYDKDVADYALELLLNNLSIGNGDNGSSAE